jgi:hypothetical protein
LKYEICQDRIKRFLVICAIFSLFIVAFKDSNKYCSIYWICLIKLNLSSAFLSLFAIFNFMNWNCKHKLILTAYLMIVKWQASERMQQKKILNYFYKKITQQKKVPHKHFKKWFEFFYLVTRKCKNYPKQQKGHYFSRKFCLIKIKKLKYQNIVRNKMVRFLFSLILDVLALSLWNNNNTAPIQKFKGLICFAYSKGLFYNLARTKLYIYFFSYLLIK